jgi:putative iron-dependent peroxidase
VSDKTSNQSTTYQSGIIAAGSPQALFITLNQVAKSVQSDSALVTLYQTIAKLPEQLVQLQSQFPQAKLLMTVGFSSAFWDKLALTTRPAELAPFQKIENAQVTMPATDADLMLHIRSERHDVNYHLALTLFDALKPIFELDEMVHGFRYLDSRDLTGFVDGTENPEGDSRNCVALVANDGEFNNGSYIHLQKYHHDLSRWQKIAVKQQEDSYGRSKQENLEYASADKLNSAHTKRASVKDGNAKSIEILRHSLPFGDLAQSGLLFASYAASPDNFNMMLQSMCEIDEENETDKILYVTSAKTGHAFYAPNLEWFENLKQLV